MDFNEYFEYRDGRLYWKIKPSRRVKIGSLADTYILKDGYRKTGLLKKTFRTHIIIYEMFHGPVPEGYSVDHKDGNKLNNALDNLRLATSTQNNWNVGLTKANSTGFKGVIWHKQARKFMASIKINKKQKFLGYYLTAEEASDAYKQAAKELHKDFYREV